MTSRTDIHRPVEMDPANYAYRFAADTGPGGLVGLMSTPEGREFWMNFVNNLDPATAHRGTSQCHHCGARLRYVAFMEYLPTGKFIVVGETCLDNRFELESKADFDRLRKAAELDRAKQRIKTAATAQIDAIGGETGMALDRETDIVEAFGMLPGSYAVNTITDIRSKLWKYGSISERQVAFVTRLLTENKGAAAKAAQVAAERAAEVKCPAPTGRVSFEGAVVKRTFFESYYGYTPTVGYKLIVKVTTPDGVWLCHVTEPSKHECERGDVVRLTATVTQSDRDNFFGFGKRPSNFSIVRKATDEEMADSLAD
jgi:hypothetical protein